MAVFFRIIGAIAIAAGVGYWALSRRNSSEENNLIDRSDISNTIDVLDNDLIELIKEEAISLDKVDLIPITPWFKENLSNSNLKARALLIDLKKWRMSEQKEFLTLNEISNPVVLLQGVFDDNAGEFSHSRMILANEMTEELRKGFGGKSIIEFK